ncbi:MAG: FtsX-like permease family protein [Bifidobacteriaceae bacterium]|jgi:putative ABC transport system permease protein|nr:FtsX-like permease family protein [Bifidobacteriaceae bacterium]
MSTPAKPADQAPGSVTGGGGGGRADGIGGDPKAAKRGRRKMAARMIARSVTRRRSRVAIAVAAVAIGATTLFSLASIALDIPRQMSREMRSYGANLLVLPADGAEAVTPEAAEAVAGTISAEQLIGFAPYRYFNVRINEQPFLASGTDLESARTVSPYWHVEGAWPERAGELLIGSDVAAVTALGAGEAVSVVVGTDAEGPVAHPFTITGVLSTGGSEDALVAMSLADAEALAGPGGYDVVEFSIASQPDQIAALAESINAEQPGQSAQPDQSAQSAQPAVRAAPVKRLTQSDTYVLDMLQSLLVIVSLIVLALTMIGVSTTMMAVVAERRTEIGLRKALGASNRSVVAEFMAEGMVLGVVGGIGGVVIGYALAVAISDNVFHRVPAFSWPLAAATCAAAVGVTWLANRVPVRRAAEVDPAIVLRGE